MVNIIEKITPQQYLAALIETYRGYKVDIPQIDADLENDLLRDLLSSAIRYCKSDEAMKAISEELFNCSRGNCSFESQVELAMKQNPEILNAKMTAAAYVMRILDSKH